MKKKFNAPSIGLITGIWIWLAWIAVPLPVAAERIPQVIQAGALDEICLGKTFLVQGRPFRKAVVGDAKVASARALAPDQLLIKGLRPGHTNLILWYEDGKPPSTFDIRVVIDPGMIAEAEALVRELVPASRVRIIPVNAEILLEGEVDSIADMQRVVQIVRPFFSLSDQSSASEDDEGKTSTTINVNTGPSSGAGGSGADNRSQLEQNLNLTLAIRNNLVVVRGRQQVQLKIKIAEVSRSGTKQMGLSFLSDTDWAVGVFSSGTAAGELAAHTVAGVQSTGILSTAKVSAPFSSAFQVLVHAVDHDILALLSLMKSQGLARILAEPTLVAMSGQSARFNVGGEFPVPIQGDGGRTTIEFKEYGTLIQFTPVVVDGKTISLKVAPEVSSPDYALGTTSGGTTVPALKTRTAETTLRLRDGQTFVMAGLLQEEVSTTISKVPFLGDLPVLGTLFTSKGFQSSETELIILVTPRLVRPLDAGEVVELPNPLPFDEIGDLDFFILNRVYGNRRGGENPATQESVGNEAPVFIGDTGFAR